MNKNQAAYKNVFLVVCTAILYGVATYTLIDTGSTLNLVIIPGVFVVFYLFSKPYLNFWVLLITAMLAGPVVSYVPGFSEIRWGVNLLAITFGLSILFKSILMRNMTLLFNEKILILFILFFTISIVTSGLNRVPLQELIISIKNNFQFFPILLFFILYEIREEFPDLLIKIVFFIALVQPPIVLFQFYIIVPKVQLLTAIQGTNLLDAVNGTFGTGLTGGGTGMYTLFTCTVLCSLLVAVSKKMISGKKFSLLSLYFLFPMFLNETKAAFLFLLAGSMVVIGFDRGVNFFKKVMLGICALLLGVAMVCGTLQMSTNYGVDAKDLIRRTFDYSSAEKGYGKYRLNRLSCLTFWWQENKNNPIEFAIGHGLDATVEGDIGLSSVGSVERRYPLYGNGLTTASRMLWETGFAGFSLFLSVFILSFFECVKLARSNMILSHMQFLSLCVAASLCMTTMMFFYNSQFRTSQPANMFITLLLGLTMWLKLQHSRLRKGVLS